MVSALDSGSDGLSSSPGRGTALCVLAQDTLLSQCLSPPRCINGYRRNNTGGNPAMDQHPIQGGESKYSKLLNATKTGISSGSMGHLARSFTCYEMSLLFVRTSLPKRVETPTRKVDAQSSSKRAALSSTCSSSVLRSYSGIQSVSLIASFSISSLHVSVSFDGIDDVRPIPIETSTLSAQCLQISLVAFGR